MTPPGPRFIYSLLCLRRGRWCHSLTRIEKKERGTGLSARLCRTGFSGFGRCLASLLLACRVGIKRRRKGDSDESLWDREIRACDVKFFVDIDDHTQKHEKEERSGKNLGVVTEIGSSKNSKGKAKGWL